MSYCGSTEEDMKIIPSSCGVQDNKNLTQNSYELVCVKITGSTGLYASINNSTKN